MQDAPTKRRTHASKTHVVTSFGRADQTYVVLAATFAVVLVLTNIIGVKLFVLWPEGRPDWFPGAGPLTLTSGIITYPLTFLLTDLVSEFWGQRRANLMVIIGFGMSLLMLFFVEVALALEPSDFWANEDLGLDKVAMQGAFEVTFQFPALLLGASMLAYLVAQLFDVYLYHFWKRLTGGSHMWLRNNGSTAISQLVDTIIVNGVFLTFGFGMAPADVAGVIVAVYLVKLVLALLDTPLIYLGRSLLARFFGLTNTDWREAPLA
ncbi:MAG: queuosine precursor transporter [Planctomycetota bacterium]